MTQSAQHLGKAFVTALLVTGSESQAEAAILQAMESCHPGDGNEAELVWRTVVAAVRDQGGLRPPNRIEPAAGQSLPLELRNTLQLAPRLRRCFVLRVLVGLPREVCARLLDLQPRRVDGYACAAMKRLARPSPADPWAAMCIGMG